MSDLVEKISVDGGLTEEIRRTREGTTDPDGKRARELATATNDRSRSVKRHCRRPNRAQTGADFSDNLALATSRPIVVGVFRNL
jgi:hypothetical protein